MAVVPVFAIVCVRSKRPDSGSSHRSQECVDGKSPESSVHIQGQSFGFADVTFARWSMRVSPIGHKLLGSRGVPGMNYFCGVDVLR
jgi:hypothetical protein